MQGPRTGHHRLHCHTLWGLPSEPTLPTQQLKVLLGRSDPCTAEMALASATQGSMLLAY